MPIKIKVRTERIMDLGQGTEQLARDTPRAKVNNRINFLTFNVSLSHFATETVERTHLLLSRVELSLLHRSRRRHMRLTGRATVVGITRAPSIAEDGGVLIKACDTNGGGRVGAVVVDVGPDQHQALQHAKTKARTYGKALLGLAGLLRH